MPGEVKNGRWLYPVLAVALIAAVGWQWKLSHNQSAALAVVSEQVSALQRQQDNNDVAITVAEHGRDLINIKESLAEKTDLRWRRSDQVPYAKGVERRLVLLEAKHE